MSCCGQLKLQNFTLYKALPNLANCGGFPCDTPSRKRVFIVFISHSQAIRFQARPRFQGQKTTDLAAQKLQTACQLKTLLDADSDPYLGQGPEELQKATGLVDTRLEVLLDALATQLRKNPKRSRQALQNARKELALPESALENLPMRFVGEGGMGRVYKLGKSPKAFALKVYKTPWETWTSGRELAGAPFQEAANGIFMTHRNTRNVSRFYVANPFRNWSLMEYIGKGSKMENRLGRTLSEQNLSLSDSGHLPNFVNGIRVDHGDELIDHSSFPGTILGKHSAILHKKANLSD